MQCGALALLGRSCKPLAPNSRPGLRWPPQPPTPELPNPAARTAGSQHDDLLGGVAARGARDCQPAHGQAGEEGLRGGLHGGRVPGGGAGVGLAEGQVGHPAGRRKEERGNNGCGRERQDGRVRTQPGLTPCSGRRREGGRQADASSFASQSSPACPQLRRRQRASQRQGAAPPGQAGAAASQRQGAAPPGQAGAAASQRQGAAPPGQAGAAASQWQGVEPPGQAGAAASQRQAARAGAALTAGWWATRPTAPPPPPASGAAPRSKSGRPPCSQTARRARAPPRPRAPG